jgi:hypothetical protein
LGGLALVVAGVGTALVGSAMAMFGIGVGPVSTTTATSRIPAAMLTLYQIAAATCPGLPRTLLAAIGTVESDNGESTLPGVHSGANAAGAEGPLQFEPAKFAERHTRCALSPTKGACPCLVVETVLRISHNSLTRAVTALSRMRHR